MNRTKTELNPADFPQEMRPFLRDAVIYDSSCSPEARVWYIDREGGLFLKKNAAGTLKQEAVMTGYFHSLGLSAEVLAFAEDGQHDYLLTRRIPGEDCTHEMYRREPERLCDLLAEKLRELHDIRAEDCPVKDRLESYRENVLRGHAKGAYEPDLFRELWEFDTAEAAWSAAEQGMPELKAEVLIHGDYCLPNVMLDNWKFTGFIDVGAGGIADRHIDVLWGLWTMMFNLHTTKYTDRFIDVYGREKIDRELLRYVAAMEMIGE